MKNYFLFKVFSFLIFVALVLLIAYSSSLSNWLQGDQSVEEFDVSDFSSTLPQVGTLYPGGFFNESASKCTSDTKLLILVFSAPANRKRRDAIRENWGSEAKNYSARLLFLVGGADLNSSLITSLQNENGGDVIFGKFVDSYRNLTFKSVALLEWTWDNCPSSRYVLKCDDDVYINLPLLVQRLEAEVDAGSKTVVGRAVKLWSPIRNPESKYYLSEIEFSPAVLPDFATGPAYVLTKQLIGPMMEAALRERWLTLEDVFLTGLVAHYRAGAKLLDWPEFTNEKVPMSSCNAQKISIHDVLPLVQKKLMIRRKMPCHQFHSYKNF